MSKKDPKQTSVAAPSTVGLETLLAMRINAIEKKAWALHAKIGGSYESRWRCINDMIALGEIGAELKHLYEFKLILERHASLEREADRE